jgi:hypothetical protein
LADKASLKKDLLMDHVLYTFPKKIIPFDQYDDDNTRSNIALSDTTFFTKSKQLKMSNGSDLDMTSTYYVLTLNVGIKGTKKRLLETTTAFNDSLAADEIAGMALSP